MSPPQTISAACQNSHSASTFDLVASGLVKVNALLRHTAKRSRVPTTHNNTNNRQPQLTFKSEPRIRFGRIESIQPQINSSSPIDSRKSNLLTIFMNRSFVSFIPPPLRVGSAGSQGGSVS